MAQSGGGDPPGYRQVRVWLSPIGMDAMAQIVMKHLRGYSRAPGEATTDSASLLTQQQIADLLGTGAMRADLAEALWAAFNNAARSATAVDAAAIEFSRAAAARIRGSCADKARKDRIRGMRWLPIMQHAGSDVDGSRDMQNTVTLNTTPLQRCSRAAYLHQVFDI